MKEFGGKVAVVTGARPGHRARAGRAVHRRGHEGRARRRRARRWSSRPRASCATRAATSIGVVTDVTSLESVEALRDATLDAYGAVHVVCNNAGIGSGSEGQIWEHHVNDWRWSLDVNVMGVVNGINAFVPTHARERRGGPRREHDVGQRRVHAADQQRGLRHHQGRGHDHHRVPLGSAARDRRDRRRVAALSVDAHARHAQHRHLATRREPSRPLRPPGAPPREGRDAPRRVPSERMDAAGMPVVFAPLEEVADLCFEGIRDDVFWITVPERAAAGEDPGAGRVADRA